MAVVDLHHKVIDASRRPHFETNVLRQVQPGGVQGPRKDDLGAVPEATEESRRLAIPRGWERELHSLIFWSVAF